MRWNNAASFALSGLLLGGSALSGVLVGGNALAAPDTRDVNDSAARQSVNADGLMSLSDDAFTRRIETAPTALAQNDPAVASWPAQTAWTVDITADLNEAQPGPALVMFYDGDDPSSVNRPATIIRPLLLTAANLASPLTLRLEMGPDEGARHNHKVRVRVMQQQDGHDVLLGDSTAILY